MPDTTLSAGAQTEQKHNYYPPSPLLHYAQSLHPSTTESMTVGTGSAEASNPDSNKVNIAEGMQSIIFNFIFVPLSSST